MDTREGMGQMITHRWFICPICGVHRWKEPPHGEGNPCPERSGMREFLKEYIEDHKAKSNIASFQTADMMQMLRKMVNDVTGTDDEEEFQDPGS